MGNCFGEKGGGGSEGGGVKKPEKPSGGGGGNSTGKQVKLILLGAGESGKSTLHKQIKLLHNEGFSEKEIKNYASQIYGNLLVSIARLYKACTDHKMALELKENEAIAEKIKKLSEDTSITLNSTDKYTKEIHANVGTLWKDKSIQSAFKSRRNLYHIFDGVQFFLDDLERLTPPDYKPTHEDILHCRSKTIGIVEIKFQYKGSDFVLLDVGGQRNERKKWKNCFEGVTAVIFVVSLSEYDQTCYEDDITNRMNESLELFDEIINGNWFKNTQVMLFLNKQDIFAEKIKKTDLKVTFPDYDGGNDFKKATDFIKQKFEDANKHDPERMHIYMTCATNSKEVEKIFNELKDLIVNKNLGTTKTV